LAIVLDHRRLAVGLGHVGERPVCVGVILLQMVECIERRLVAVANDLREQRIGLLPAISCGCPSKSASDRPTSLSASGEALAIRCGILNTCKGCEEPHFLNLLRTLSAIVPGHASGPAPEDEEKFVKPLARLP
jgi:hypothetical protein